MPDIKRPLPVVIIGFIYILAGATGIVYHLIGSWNFDLQYFLILCVRLIAIVGGIFILLRIGWARWLLIAWIAFHFILSFWHSMTEVIIHFLILVLTLTCLFNRNASKYFQTE